MINRIITTLGILFAAGTTAAESVYLNANVGYANVGNWWTGSAAFTLNGGYNFNNYFATEAGYTWIYPIAIAYPDNSQIPGNYSANQSFLDIAAKGSLPFSDIFNVYIKGGLGLGFTSSTAIASSASSNWNGVATGISPGIYMALGGELKLSQHLQLTAEDYGLIPLSSDNYGNVNVFGVGAKYTF